MSNENHPKDFLLQQNYPNPFNPETTIQYTIDKPRHLTMKIYNINGELIKTLINETIPAGNHQVKWNGTNEFGEKVSSGIYFSNIKSENFTSTLKMMMLK